MKLGNDFMEERTKNPGYLSIEDVGFSLRTFNCLNRARISYLGSLASMRRSDLMKIRNLGKTNIDEIEYVLQTYGFKLIEEDDE